MHYGLGVLWDAMASLQDIPRSKMHMALFCIYVCLFVYLFVCFVMLVCHAWQVYSFTERLIVVYVERSGSGVEFGLLIKRTRVRILRCGVKTLDTFFHSTLVQFTQLYKCVTGNRQWWICVRAVF